MKKRLLVCLVLVAAMVLCAAAAMAMEVAEGDIVNYTDLDTISKIAGHVVGGYTVTKQPTCTEKGMAYFVCTSPELHADTDTQHYVFIKENGHKWSSEVDGENWGKVIEPLATCTSEGKAIDVCTVCGLENPEHYRIIDKIPHVYNNNQYKVVKEPTCTEFGYGIRVCIHCGTENPEDVKQWNATNTTAIQIPMADHSWSDWRIDKPSTCDEYGEAHRACTVCGAAQVLNTTIQQVQDHGTNITIDDVIPKKNPKWADAQALLDGQKFNDEKKLNAALKKAKGLVVYDEVKNWLLDCYTREITLRCRYCGGNVHPDIKYQMIYPLTVAHTWVLSPDLSQAPTCLNDGYNYYICDKDDKHGHDMSTVYPDDPAFKKEKVAALGHDFGEWEIAEEYTKDGEAYVLMVRQCSRCKATENKVIKKSDIPVPPVPEVKNGLVKDEDGVWRYYEDDKFVEKTAIVTFQGGEFWVVKGVLASDANGLTICPDGKAYFLAQGQIQRVSQVAEYKGNWFMIKDGMLDESANGLYDYDGGTFVFAAGRLRKDVNGLWQNPKDNKWYFLANGQVQKVSQVAEYNGEFFLVKDGVLDTAYKGTIEYDGETFIVVNGQLYEPLKEEA